MPYSDSDKKRKHHVEYMRKRRNQWIEDHGPCAKCGSKEGLEVDHVDPFTKLVLHNRRLRRDIFELNKSLREAELAKCQVLCHNCHVKKTRLAYTEKRKHGTITMYSNGKCRCDKCKAASALYARKRRERAT